MCHICFFPPVPANHVDRVVLELGIYTSHIIWRIRYRKLRKEAKATGKSIDELLDAQNGEGSTDVESGVVDPPTTDEEPSAFPSKEPPDEVEGDDR